MKSYKEMLSVFSLVSTLPVSNDNTAGMGIIVIIAIIFLPPALLLLHKEHFVKLL